MEGLGHAVNRLKTKPSPVAVKTPSVTNSDQNDNLSRLDPPKGSELSKFSKYSFWVLGLNLLIIAWGVLVRASKSGDGCGNHWPLCNGPKDPLMGSVATFIEGAHRLSTSFDGLLVIGLTYWAFRSFSKGTQVRKAASAAMFFTIVEGFIGAALVTYKLVTTNESVQRAGVMSFHVISTFFLVSSITLCAFLGSKNREITVKKQGAVGWMVTLSFVTVAIMGVTGAISALGHTLDPVANVLKAAANPHTFWMVRVQPIHPYIALAVGMFLLLVVTLISNLRPCLEVRRSGAILLGAYGTELIVGYINIYFQAPIWVQMVHLATADALVVALAWFSAEALRKGLRHRELETVGAEVQTHPVGIAKAKEFLMLTKPRVISLLLFTTLASMIAADRGWPNWILFIAVAIGGYFAAGSANTFNMVVERDLDLAMRRTSSRPTVTAHVSPPTALGFALILMFASFAILWGFANILTAILAESGLVFYVSIYTLGLKRRTWQNIVIGGAAGAIPPLVGYAAVDNSLALVAWILFGIIFLWTPVHFWALAILLKEDYAAAGVPMLPVVKSLKITSHQIALYTILTVIISFAPFIARWVGYPYAICAVLLNVWLVVLCSRLVKNPERKQASGLFHFSMIYLALLFVALATDRTLIRPVDTSARVDFYKSDLGHLTERQIPTSRVRGAMGVTEFTLSSNTTASTLGWDKH